MSDFDPDPRIIPYLRSRDLGPILRIYKTDPEEAKEMADAIFQWYAHLLEDDSVDQLWEPVREIELILKKIDLDPPTKSFGKILLMRQKRALERAKKSEKIQEKLYSRLKIWDRKVRNKRTRMSTFDKIEKEVEQMIKSVEASEQITNVYKGSILSRINYLVELMTEKKRERVEKEVKRQKIVLDEINMALTMGDLGREGYKALAEMLDEVQLSYSAFILEDEIDEVYEKLRPHL